jgi:hypothetical protein
VAPGDLLVAAHEQVAVVVVRIPGNIYAEEQPIAVGEGSVDRREESEERPGEWFCRRRVPMGEKIKQRGTIVISCCFRIKSIKILPMVSSSK